MAILRSFIILLLMCSVCRAETTYKLREEVTYIQPEVKPVNEVKKYYADIYINGNLLADGVEVTDKEVAGDTARAFITAYNKNNGTKIPTVVEADK